MDAYDPREHVRGIHQILISDKKRIGFLFGARLSYATGLPTLRIPATATMTKTIVVVMTHNRGRIDQEYLDNTKDTTVQLN